MSKLRMSALRAVAAGAALALVLGASAMALAQGTATSANLALAKSDSPDPVREATTATGDRRRMSSGAADGLAGSFGRNPSASANALDDDGINLDQDR
jgi:Flp pilus assembly protein TadB